MNIFVEKRGASPMDVSTIFSKLGQIYMSNFGLAVGCTTYWLPSLDKICKHYFLGLKDTPQDLFIFI